MPDTPDSSRIPEPRPTLPASPHAIAAELEPIIERLTLKSADYVLAHLEGRLTKIEHQLQVAAQHDKQLLTEVMDLKLRMDNHAARIERIEAALTLQKALPALPKAHKKKMKVKRR